MTVAGVGDQEIQVNWSDVNNELFEFERALEELSDHMQSMCIHLV
jgi:hypothetical protein